MQNCLLVFPFSKLVRCSHYAAEVPSLVLHKVTNNLECSHYEHIVIMIRIYK